MMFEGLNTIQPSPRACQLNPRKFFSIRHAQAASDPLAPGFAPMFHST